MARVWKAGGQELYDDQVPFQPGTEQYYRYIAQWRANAMGISYGQTGPPGQDDDRAQGDAYKDGLNAWWDQQMNLVELESSHYNTGIARDARNGMVYQRDEAGAYHDADGDGTRDAGEVNAGVYGGVGNRGDGLAPYDNAWNDLWGEDIRTDQQKFYDRNLSGYQQVADANGTYSTYADWEYRDKDGATQKKQINLTAIGKRKGSTGNGPYDRAGDEDWGGTDYWNYNNAPEKSFFDDMTRNRKNLSPYARTA